MACSFVIKHVFFVKSAPSNSFWNLIAKSPKRNISTVYLREGEKEKLIEKVEEFYSLKTRDIYLSYGESLMQETFLKHCGNACWNVYKPNSGGQDRPCRGVRSS